MQNKNTEAAFVWIAHILEKHNIAFQIFGGLAARSYGARRGLADIDIGMREERIAELLPEISAYITYGPAHYNMLHCKINLS